MPRISVLYRILACVGILCGSCVCAGLLTGFVPRDEGIEMRRVASQTIARLRSEDLPLPIESFGDQTHLWAVRQKVVFTEPSRTEPEKEQMLPVRFAEEAPFLAVREEENTYRKPSCVLVPLLALDGFSQPDLVTTQSDEFDAFDSAGVPVRWRIRDTLQAGYTPVSLRRSLPGPEEKAVARAAVRELLRDPMVRKIVAARSPQELQPSQGSQTSQSTQAAPVVQVQDTKGLERARAFQDLIDTYAARYGLDPSLLKAIIYSESNFNTRVVSHRSAVGLMQVLPSTASGEIHRFLYGRHGQVSRSDLHDPATNIQYGTAYLHILTQRYFPGIRDPRSLEYCIVAAYNMGPHRVMKIFGTTPQSAANVINSMSSEDVYQHLTRRLPRQETRAYVAKVRNVKQQYVEGEQAK